MLKAEPMIQSHSKTIYEILGREPIHPFPARMAPGIALDAIAHSKKPLRVLDPMMGSGTVLAVARSKGHWAIGVDIDPLAVLISKVWTTAVDASKVRDKAAEVLHRARNIFATLRVRDAYPIHADHETRRFVAYWFDGYARRQLSSLAMAISRIRDRGTRDILWCAFSRLIISKQSGASLAMDLSHSRPHKYFDQAPAKPFRRFLASVDRVVENCVDRDSRRRGPSPRIYEGDARILPLQDASIDLVVTSPPYLNAIDYMRCSKFSLVWMGHRINDLRRLRTRSIGSEVGETATQLDPEVSCIIGELKLLPELNPREKAVLVRYIKDMRRAVHEVARVLRPAGRAVYVVGENTIRGTYVPNSAIISAVAEASGLRLESRRVRMLAANRRYLPPPSASGDSAALDTRMRSEVILVLRKVARHGA